MTDIETMVDMLDKDTAAVTAFPTWEAFREAMGTGYVPTVYGSTKRQRRLIRTLRALGFRVWGNKGRNW